MIIEDPNRRRLVIPDIHGCYSTLLSLLDKIRLKKEDYVFLLGDYIKRGARSREVLDLIKNLMDQGYNIFPLRGNHEQMLLDADSNFKNSRFIFPGIRKPEELYNENNQLISKYVDFLKGLPYYFELDNFLLVHAGFNTAVEDPFEDTSSMIWIDKFDYNTIKLKGKRVIHGHAPKEMEEILFNISNRSMIIPLDNGVNDSGTKTKGNLVCLDIDKMDLTIQENIDNESLCYYPGRNVSR
jgi:serine/threonine protein phosphatase 1